MVNIKEIQNSNSNLKAGGSGLVAVVVGGTSGIGGAFLRQFAINSNSPKIYFLGRSSSQLDDIQRELTSLNPSGQYIPIQVDDLTLLRNVDKASEQIKATEKKIDLLYLSAGYATFSGRSESDEGLDKFLSIAYYSRMRFIYNFISQLNQAPLPRVITVLAGGGEGAIFPDDLLLEKHYSISNAPNAASTYTTLTLERLHQQYPNISFVHMFPGLSLTNLWSNKELTSNWFAKLFVKWIVLPLLGPFLFRSADEVGQRALFAATNEKFRVSNRGSTSVAGDGVAEGSNGEVGSGVYTLNDKTEAVHSDKVLKPYRESGMPEKIWDHTLQVFDRVLSS